MTQTIAEKKNEAALSLARGNYLFFMARNQPVPVPVVMNFVFVC